MNTDEIRAEARVFLHPPKELLFKALDEIDRLRGELRTCDALLTVGKREAFVEEIEQRTKEACKRYLEMAFLDELENGYVVGKKTITQDEAMKAIDLAEDE